MRTTTIATLLILLGAQVIATAGAAAANEVETEPRAAVTTTDRDEARYAGQLEALKAEITKASGAEPAEAGDLPEGARGREVCGGGDRSGARTPG